VACEKGFIKMLLGFVRRVVLLAALTINQFPLSAAESFSVVGSFQLPPTSLGQMGSQPFTSNDMMMARTNGLKFDDLPSIGSGLARLGENEFVGISDRGPNGEVGGRRTFPLPRFAPYLTRFKLVAGKIEILQTIVFTAADGKPLTGVSNEQGQERLFEAADASKPLPYDPNGIDPEAVRVFPDGKFLLSEEYGPSLLVVSSTGQVLMRYRPIGGTNSAQSILPPVLSQRRTNRGFEALALSPDGKTAFVMLQSPLVHAEHPGFKAARVSRVVRLDLSDPLNARITGHFLLPLSRASDYDATLKQADVKLNDAEWLAPDKLLVLEQAGETARLLVADFSAAGDLRKTRKEYTVEPEAAGDDFKKLPVQPAAVEVWATLSGLTKAPTKLEGLAILSPTEIAISNDNDFGIGDKGAEKDSYVWSLRLSDALPMSR
jgi:hypothetical protein